MSLRHRCFRASRRALPSSASLFLALHRQPLPRRGSAGSSAALSTTAAPAATSSPTAAASSLAASAAAATTVPPPWACDDVPQQLAPRPSAAPEPLPAAPAAASHFAPRCLSIVTGASRGLGAAIARVLAARGPPLPPAAAAAAAAAPTTPAWASHDLALLASDHVRLERFVERELTPLLEQHRHVQPLPPPPPQQQQQQQQQQQRSQTWEVTQHPAAPRDVPPGGGGGGGGGGKAEVDSPGAACRPPSTVTAACTAAPTTSATTPTPTPTPTPTSILTGAPTNSNSTRVRTACFDLGDLDALGANTARLLSAAGADAAAAAAAASRPENSCTGGGGGGIGSGDGLGVLPLPPSAYTHVLLIHNAGQVGDLAPLELQGLDNIRRQTDLNVTSFAHLTAALLRTFLHAPVLPDAAAAATAAVADAGERSGGAGSGACSLAAGPQTAAAAPQQPVGRGRCPQEAEGEVVQGLKQQGQQQTPQRRVITIVNISSVSVDQPYEHFSLYGMGKAARHMLVRSVAHEAALREAAATATEAAAATEVEAAAASHQTAALPSSSSSLPPCSRGSVARVRVLSYAPGAIDTEMQAAAREALPAGPLKSRFEDNARCGRLVDPWVSAQVLYDILAADAYDNGAHVDYYSAVADAGGNDAAHPLAPARDRP